MAKANKQARRKAQSAQDAAAVKRFFIITGIVILVLLVLIGVFAFQ